MHEGQTQGGKTNRTTIWITEKDARKSTKSKVKKVTKKYALDTNPKLC